MKKITLVSAILLAVNLNAPVHAQGFLQNLLKLEIPKSASPGSGTPGGDSKVVGGKFCESFFGAPYKQKKLNDLPEKVVAKYFRVSPETDKEFADGASLMHAGSLTSLQSHLVDINDKVIRQLADAYVANPSIPMMAQVIAYSESGDGYSPENGPSELTEAKTLLAMMMMQYPKLTLNTGSINQLLRQADVGKSGLATTLLARNHLFGDYAPKNINTFSNYIAQAQSRYPIKLADRTVFYALEKIPNWSYREQWLNGIKSSQDMQRSFQNQKQAASTTDFNRRAMDLMVQGNRADSLTLEALGAAPKIAEIKAKGEMLRREAAGELNLIKVEVSVSDETKAEIIKLLAAAPVLDDAAKAKYNEALKIKADNLNRMYDLTVGMILSFLSLDMGVILEKQQAAQYISQYNRNTCQLINRQVEVAKQSGMPVPQLDAKKLSQSLL